jgi:hypothetical protein
LTNDEGRARYEISDPNRRCYIEFKIYYTWGIDPYYTKQTNTGYAYVKVWGKKKSFGVWVGYKTRLTIVQAYLNGTWESYLIEKTLADISTSSDENELQRLYYIATIITIPGVMPSAPYFWNYDGEGDSRGMNGNHVTIDYN